MTPQPPCGLQLEKLPDDPAPVHTAARRFCLDVIKEFYGFDYRREWHEDLDSLELRGSLNHYASCNRSAFWCLSTPDGQLVATAGLRGLSWKPALLQDLAERYPEGDKVASLWRVYIRKDWRGKGIGKWLVALAEDEARRLGYAVMYLHASTDATDTMKFWKSAGYHAFGTLDFSTHFDKPL